MFTEQLLCDRCYAGQDRHKDRQDMVPNPTQSSGLVGKGNCIRKPK